MRALLQRVSRASVRVEGETVASIDGGLLVLLGVERDDEERDAEYLARKTAEVRIFPDENGQMNRGLLDTGGAVLVVSQFTLASSTRKGRRPSFSRAAAPERAEALYECYAQALSALGVPVQRGVFRAMMEVELVNDGPVTLLLDPPPWREGG